MSTHAAGTFEVTMNPEPPFDAAPGAALGRMAGTKRFHGDLEGTSTVTMLSARTEVKGSAGYVAIERVTATLHGLAGTFVLQHSGTMNRGASSLSVAVVPDSGTGALTGLSGSMTIAMTDGQHAYEFEYALDGRPRPS